MRLRPEVFLAWVTVVAGVAVLGVGLGAPPQALAAIGDFEVEITSPASELVVRNEQTVIAVEGTASIRGGIPKLDLFLVMDTSKSLQKRDPEDHRSSGAVGLVKLLMWSDARIGVVDFDKKGQIVSPLTKDRTVVIKALRALDQNGKTDLAGGIRAALQGFRQGGRPGSTRVMLLFTDGRTKQKSALEALDEARQQGVLINTLLLGSDEKGTEILREIAEGSGGLFVAVRDPASLPDAFSSLRSGVQHIEFRVNDSEPISPRLAGETFAAEVPLTLGENRISLKARSIDGREQEDVILVTVRSPGCAELDVQAERDGRPALSLSNRAVEIVVDASGSMWGQMDGRTKIEIAKEILDDALEWLPPDLNLSLRAYGHRYDRKAQNCEDSELLVPPGSGNRGEIRKAIRGLQPKGQTPLGYSLAQVSDDFGDFEGERAVVLVTDGIESCGGDAPGEARELQARDAIQVHVIGFGLAGRADEDLASLRAIAEASGGRYVSAGSAAELRQALSTTVGTPYRLSREGTPVARGTLGSDERILLPAGDYRLELDSTPPVAMPVSLVSEEALTLVLRREGAEVLHTLTSEPTEYVLCQGQGRDPGEAEAAPSSSSP